MSTRYHQAAADGNLEVLKEATRKDLNTSDTDGMTPTLLVAYHGNLEALEIICRRGGDPDKCDIWGNTPLHHAAINGHIHCVSFLINVGANIFALDNDMRSPLDVAASRNQYECVRILDNAATEQTIKNPKRVSRLKAQAPQDAARQIRECERRQEKHEDKMNRNFNKGSMYLPRGTATRQKVSNFFAYSSLSTLPKQLKDTFKLRTKKKGENVDNQEAGSSGREEDIAAGRTAVMDVFNENDEEELPSEFNRKASISEGEEEEELRSKSIFNRPGLGNIVFRSNFSMGKNADSTSTKKEDVRFKIPNGLLYVEEPEEADDPDVGNDFDESWAEEEIGWDDGKVETTPLEVFLASQNLDELLPGLMRENIDLEALMLCSDEDLRNIQMQLGPRKKILNAINRRKQALESPGKA
ncbi:ankyrin repeat and SAM domain-containing protein 4B [Sceloporus undulatus]|uniref:ankyrin repeat and SAM domain-containing protein 4B n=1 Tax=Sceloporus undulatus TaxID=8520 RepID=UPI001C4B76F5|nr:ankyrin repeat and SAM domain-containing protein 4B [Sceloporus undulatus]